MTLIATRINSALPGAGQAIVAFAAMFPKGTRGRIASLATSAKVPLIPLSVAATAATTRLQVT